MSFQLLRRLGQKDLEFEAYLGYRVSQSQIGKLKETLKS